MQNCNFAQFYSKIICSNKFFREIFVSGWSLVSKNCFYYSEGINFFSSGCPPLLKNGFYNSKGINFQVDRVLIVKNRLLQ